jgi:hypothetical protein
MKTAILLAVAIVVLSSVPFMSRPTDAAAQENAGPHAVSPQVNSSAATAAPARSMQIPNQLDAKSSLTQSARAVGALVEAAKEKGNATTDASSRQ